MADKPFLTDVKELRRRARQHIEEGAVTEGYRGDRETVIKLLNFAPSLTKSIPDATGI